MLASEDAFYRDLGTKLAVGMPLRDIATADSVFLREIPAATDEKALRSIRRLQEIGVGIIAPIAALAAHPIANAVALVAARDAPTAAMPQGAVRLAITFDGTETAEEIAAALQAS
jgi:(E)-4-hydroxy-3-methylbut-2-enyl-diphosphate synthase